MNSTQIILNYCLNRFCPMIFLGFLIFMNFDLTSWEPYAIIGLMVFMDRFQFKVGYSVGYCDAQGIAPSGPPLLSPKKNIPKDESEVDDR